MFWFGDLNFRLDNSKLKSSEEIARSVKNVKSSSKTAKTLTNIWAQDELTIVMQHSEAFIGFFEILPMFPPTYRYVVGSCSYDLKYVFTENNKYFIKVYKHIFINSTYDF